MKKVACLGFALAIVAGGHSASAQPVGPVNPPFVPFTLHSGVNNIGATLSATSFTDVYNFAVPTNNGLDGLLFALTANNPVDFSSVTLEDSLSNVVSPIGGTGTITHGSMPAFVDWSALYGNLVPGNYSLTVVGTGSVGSNYLGQLTLASAPIPPTLSLFLTGFALLVTAAFWRQRSSARAA